MKYFIVLLLSIQAGLGATCSKNSLKVIYINGNADRNLRPDILAKGLETILDESGLIDEKGSPTVIYKKTNFGHSQNLLIAKIAQLVVARFGHSALAARQIAEGYVEDATEDFVNLYGAEALDEAEKAFGDFLEKFTFEGYTEAIAQQLEIIELNSRDQQKLLVVSHGIGSMIADRVLSKLHLSSFSKRNIVHFTFSPIRNHLISSKYYPTRHFSVARDPLQSGQSLFATLPFAPNYAAIGPSGQYMNGILEGYLSEIVRSDVVFTKRLPSSPSNAAFRLVFV